MYLCFERFFGRGFFFGKARCLRCPLLESLGGGGEGFIKAGMCSCGDLIYQLFRLRGTEGNNANEKWPFYGKWPPWVAVRMGYGLCFV